MKDIKLKIDNEEFIIKPELTLGEYMVLQKTPKEKLTTPKLMEIITGIPENTIKKMDNKTSKYVVNKILTTKMDTQDKNVYSTFEFNGTLYGLETDLTKINFGGWIDLETFISLGYKENLNKIVALFYRPIEAQLGKTYVLKPYDTTEAIRRSEEFLDLPFKYVVGANVFFLKFTEIYIRDTIHSLKQKNKKTKNRIKAVSYMKKILPNWLVGKLPQDFIKPN